MSYMPMNPMLAPRTTHILCTALPVPPAICPSVLHTLLALHTAPGQARGVPRHSSPDICCFRGLSGCGGPLGPGEQWQRPSSHTVLQGTIVSPPHRGGVSDHRSRSSGWRVEGVLCHLPWSLDCKVNLTWINIKILCDSVCVCVSVWHTDAMCMLQGQKLTGEQKCFPNSR